jgi:hypothetical protein
MARRNKTLFKEMVKRGIEGWGHRDHRSKKNRRYKELHGRIRENFIKRKEELLVAALESDVIE